MVKKKIKQYTAVVDLFYTQEASASYTINAEDSQSALERLF